MRPFVSVEVARAQVEIADRTVKLRADGAAAAADAAAWAAAIDAWTDFAVEQDGLAGVVGNVEEPPDDDDTGRDRGRAPSGAPPPPLAGDLALKKPHRYRTDTWSKRHARVDPATGTLEFHKTAADAAAGAPPLLAADLRLTTAIAKHNKSGASDPTRFGFAVPGANRPVKLKAKTAADADAWVASLQQWQDHLLLTTKDAASMV